MNQEKNKVNTANTANTAKNEGYSDVYENCYVCGRNMYKVKQIWVDTEKDTYLCCKCKDIHNIDAVRCAEI